MGILRSEEMRHGTLVLPTDRARHFIDLIGSGTKMQFEDMNARDMHRPYKKNVQRLDEMERMIRFLVDELAKVPQAEILRNNVDSFLRHSDEYKLEEIEAKLKKMYHDFTEFKENNAQLTGRRNAALEESYVVKTALLSMAQVSATRRPKPLREADSDRFDLAATRSLLDDEEGGEGRRMIDTMFSNVAGVIPQADQDRFSRTLFRATRGNTFTHFQQIFEPMKDPKTGREVQKSVFVIYFQDTGRGSPTSAMSEKIMKICSSFGVNTYRWPQSPEHAKDREASLDVQVADQQRLLRAHEQFVRSEVAILLEKARPGGNSTIEEWRLFCAKEKSIYATLNLFEGSMSLRANCWYPAAEEDDVRRLLIQQSSSQGGHSSAMLVPDRMPPKRMPPTYIRRNEFTALFQDLVDEIGKPRYGEANPALFAVVSFPFLFGIMYGDIGHGLMILMVGSYAVWKADELRFSLPGLYAGRYILFLMGFFAVYVGFLYNDIFSLGLNLFGSRWEDPGSSGHDETGKVRTFVPLFDTRNQGGPGPYPFGIDPAWHGAQNQLVFMNSLKMKSSVIVGVTQMILGLLLRFSNALYFRNYTDFCCECIPMMVFMLCFFGWMDYLILYKWVTALESPPSIINSMIAMAMWQEDPNPMLGESLPRLLMVITILSVPLILIPKPIIVLMRHRAEQQERLRAAGRHNGGLGPTLPLGDEECLMEDEEGLEEFDFSEIAIHQVIETIEYVLGTISHTASYLRLWALSLAHQQLSSVFFSMTLVSGMEVSFPLNIITIYFTFAVWFGITVAVLLGMDSMECFLHTLRLHWVEFQSKFYKADGWPFVPFCHKDVLTREDE